MFDSLAGKFWPRVRFWLRFVASEKPQTFDLDWDQKGKRCLTCRFLQRLRFPKKMHGLRSYWGKIFWSKCGQTKLRSKTDYFLWRRHYGNLTDGHENTFFSRKFTILPTPSRLWWPISHGECIMLLPKPYKLGQAGPAVTDRRARAGLRMQ